MNQQSEITSYPWDSLRCNFGINSSY